MGAVALKFPMIGNMPTSNNINFDKNANGKWIQCSKCRIFKQGLFSSTVEQHHVWEKTVNLKHKGKIDRIVNGKWKITAFSDMLDKSI